MRRSILPRLVLPILVVLIMAASAAVSDAETFVLNNGGTVEGDLLNPEQSPRESYEVQTRLGRITLRAREVRRVRSESPEERWYQVNLPKMPATLDGNWKMAEMCRERGLTELRRIHLENVLEFDPAHEPARRALGYTQVDGKWIRTDVWMREQGLERYNGSWLSPQEIKILKISQEAELREKDWRRKVRMWRSWLGRGKRHADAIANFRQLNDPIAGVGLADLLEKEKNKEVKLLLIETLGRLKSPAGVQVFLQLAMTDADSDIVDKCLDHLVKFGGAQAGNFLLGKGGLQSTDNAVVNRAALAVGRLRPDGCVSALIDALVTNHKFVQQPKGGAGSINPVFGSGGSGGLSMGGKPKIVRRDLPNQSVHDALMAVTGGVVDFKFDEQRWKYWLASEQTPRAVNLRRRF